MNNINYSKRSLALGAVFIFNLIIAALLFIGASKLAARGTDNFRSMKDAAKEKGAFAG